MILDGCIIVIWRDLQRDPQLHEQLSAHTCTGPIWVISCHVPSVPEPSLTLMPSDAMASRHIPLSPQTLSKVYFIILSLLSYVIPMSNYNLFPLLCHYAV